MFCCFNYFYSFIRLFFFSFFLSFFLTSSNCSTTPSAEVRNYCRTLKADDVRSIVAPVPPRLFAAIAFSISAKDVRSQPRMFAAFTVPVKPTKMFAAIATPPVQPRVFTAFAKEV